MNAHHMTRRTLIRNATAAAAGAGLAWLPTQAAAQAAPGRPVRFVLPYSAGTGPDFVARSLANDLKDMQVVIDNKTGANGIVAFTEFKRAAPDGQNLMLATNDQFVTNRVVYKSLPYDESNWTYVTGVYQSTFVIAASAASGVKSLRDLLALGKQRQLTYATLGKGSLSHVAAEQFGANTGVSILHIPFRDFGSLTTAMVVGDVDFTILPMKPLETLVNTGKGVVLASLSPARQVYFQNIPTITEAGGPAMMHVRGWLAVAAPKGTPNTLIEKIQADVQRVVRSEPFRAKLATAGYETFPASPGDLERLAADEFRQIKQIATASGIQLD